MKIALGMIVKNLDKEEELMRFIDNAEKYGHKLECVIVAYAKRLDPRAVHNINKKVPLFAININQPDFAIDQFRRRGISPNAIQTLLECPVGNSLGLVPYGYNRNLVLIEAILREVDILLFTDNDVYPKTVKTTPDGPVNEDIDFFGAHLENLKSGSQITTGEYSGYNILPQAVFDGMDDLLHGLQKSDMLTYWQNSGTHRCLTVRPPEHTPIPCSKILGGNTAMTLSAFKNLPPFFSSSYMVGDELFLCRGEDTLLGLSIAKSGTVCTDIGLYPLHDTYKNYPLEPDLRNDPKTQERFYYACTGWVGRNPFYNYLRGEHTESTKEYQREKLERGLRALASYTSNPRYYSVLRNFDVSWGELGRYINEYEQVLEAWDELIKRSD